MSDGDALLRAILIDPDDTTARLVYADWLDENAGPAACPDCGGAGVRVGWRPPAPGKILEPVREPCTRCDRTGRVTRDDRRRRAAAIRGTPRPVRRDISTVLPSCGAGRCVIRYGFVEELSLPIASFRRHAAPLFAAHPVARVTLTDRHPRYVRGRRGATPDYRLWVGNDDHTSSPLCLPVCWFRPEYWPDNGRVLYYPAGACGYATRAAALAALAAVCAARGRELAGLPPTPSPAGFPAPAG